MMLWDCQSAMHDCEKIPKNDFMARPNPELSSVEHPHLCHPLTASYTHFLGCTSSWTTKMTPLIRIMLLVRETQTVETWKAVVSTSALFVKKVTQLQPESAQTNNPRNRGMDAVYRLLTGLFFPSLAAFACCAVLSFALYMCTRLTGQ
jgi:hypothetical protein